MSRATRATRQLEAAGIAYQLHAYDFEADAMGGKGLHAAQSLGVPGERVLKTLMAWVDDRAVCAVIPSDRHLQFKRLAAACQGKSARMMEIAEAERRSGYKVGGISPFGQQRPVTIIVEAGAQQHDTVYLNAGQRGLLLEIPISIVIAVLGAHLAVISE